MAIIKVPESVAVSPQDGSLLHFNTESRLFKDKHDNIYGIDDLAGSRPGNAVRRWVRENYPERD